METREVAKAADGFARVHREFRDQNMGLANSIVTGVTSVIEKHGAVIVVEDDIIVASSFLEYMNDGLSVYAGSENVGCVSGYTYPIDIEAPETFLFEGQSVGGGPLGLINGLFLNPTVNGCCVSSKIVVSCNTLTVIIPFHTRGCYSSKYWEKSIPGQSDGTLHFF